MTDVDRIPADQARAHVARGQAVPVCAYDDDAKCASMRLDGAITMNELRQRLSSIARDQEIILYCA
jgi:hypothetical protein